MIDVHYTDPTLARLYDRLCADRRDFDFYLPLVMSAARVLDVGCGTGALLRLAREAGHTGRLRGLDPAAAMLDVARRRVDIEWVNGELASVAWNREFDLIVMTGHAFQALTEDDQIQSALAAIRAALADDGRFAFETRNPLVRAWEQWRPGTVDQIVDDGAPVTMDFAHLPVSHGDLVTFTMRYTSPRWDRPRLSRSTLRFLTVDAVAGFLADAGLAIEQQFGTWDRQPLADSSPEIITIARRSRG